MRMDRRNRGVTAAVIQHAATAVSGTALRLWVRFLVTLRVLPRQPRLNIHRRAARMRIVWAFVVEFRPRCPFSLPAATAFAFGLPYSLMPNRPAF